MNTIMHTTFDRKNGKIIGRTVDNLTDKQKKVLDFIKNFTEENSFSPTYREIATHFDTTIKTAQDHIEALKKKGAITSVKGKSRSIKIIREGFKTDIDYLEIPIVGKIAAGIPILVEENIDSYITLPSKNFSKTGDYFALKVKGDSMKDEGIIDGDTAIIRSTNIAKNGMIVAASVGDDGLTLKTFYKEPNRIKLAPANEKYNPIFSQDVTIYGVLTTILRNYE